MGRDPKDSFFLGKPYLLLVWLLFPWPHHEACRKVVPWPEFGPTPFVLEVRSLNHWTIKPVLPPMLLPVSCIAEECKGRIKVKVELIRSVLLHRLGQSVNADSDLVDQEWELSFDISSKLPSDAAAADPWPTLWATITSFYMDFLSKLGGWAGLSQNLVGNMMKGTGSITRLLGLIFKVKLPSDLRSAKHMRMNHLDVVSSSPPHSYPGTLVKAFPLQTLSQLVPEPVLIKVYRRQLRHTDPRIRPLSSDWGCFPHGTSGKEHAYQSRRCKRCWFGSWVRKIPWRGAW